jgi:hypothetical protein
MHRRAHTQSDHGDHTKTNITQAEPDQGLLLHHFGARRTRTHTTDAEFIASAQGKPQPRARRNTGKARSMTRESLVKHANSRRDQSQETRFSSSVDPHRSAGFAFTTRE